MAALEAAGKQSGMVRHDLISTFQVLARNHDEVGVVCKQCGEGFGVSPIDSLGEVCNDFSDGLFFGFFLSICERSKGKQNTLAASKGCSLTCMA